MGCSEKLLTHVSELWEEKPECIPEPEGSSKSFAESLGAEGRQSVRRQVRKKKGKEARSVVCRPRPGLGCVSQATLLWQRGQRKTKAHWPHTVVSSGLDLNVFRFCGLLQNVGRVNTEL